MLLVSLTQMEVVFRTTQMEHEFGRPFQLGHHAAANKAEDAETCTLPVKPGDVIVMGTDGLLDNLSETEMVSEVCCGPAVELPLSCNTVTVVVLCLRPPSHAASSCTHFEKPIWRQVVS